jgi:hypothetical protein
MMEASRLRCDSEILSRRFRIEFLRSSLIKMIGKPILRYSLRWTISWTRRPLKSWPSKMVSEKDLRTSTLAATITREEPKPSQSSKSKDPPKKEMRKAVRTRTVCSLMPISFRTE